jgi:pimeloyl-ACP methyl ester carboxylesterase
VLIHAGIADRRMWRDQIPMLVAAGYRVLAPDLRGFGESPPAREPYSHADDVLACMDEAGIARATVVGVSMGGDVALGLTLAAPDRVAGLVLVSTLAAMTAPSDTLRRVWETSGEAFERGEIEEAVRIEVDAWVIGHGRAANDVEPGYLELATTMVRRTWERAASGLEIADELEPDPPLAERLNEVAEPVLLLVGNRDLPDVAVSMDALAAGIPHAERTVIADCAHLPPLEHAGEFNRLLLEFLERTG